MKKMPVLFIGHGSPQNIIEENRFTKCWEEVAKRIPKPKAIVSVSAHWFTRGSYVTWQEKPKQIYDFYGFPDELYEIRYRPVGDPVLAKEIARMETTVEPVDAHGIDHGTWCPLKKMFPLADIPTIQMSVDGTRTFEQAIAIGHSLKKLREQGYLILASGDVVHNLALCNFDKTDGYAWAYQFDEYIKNAVVSRDTEKLLHYQNTHSGFEKAFQTPEHFLPLFYAYGATDKTETPYVFAEGCTLGSISMTSYAWGL